VSIVDLGKTYRNAGEHKQAAQTFRDSLASVSAKVDYNEVIRGYWYEWSVCEANRGKDREHVIANIWIGGISLSDRLYPSQITDEDIWMVFNGVGFAFGKISLAETACRYAKALRAIAQLGPLTNPNPRTARFFEGYNRKADELKTPTPRNVSEAVEWLAAGVVEAGRELQDPFLKSLANPEQVLFESLQRLLEPQLGRQSQKRKRNLNKTASPSAPQQPKKSHSDALVADAIEKVARKAWEVVLTVEFSEERLKLAKREAVRLFPTLSPYVRRQVEHHFTSQGWKPLIVREPKAKDRFEAKSE
ncbi:MAG: hypothetical protein ACREKL_03025, partial [Chthoniobacterales bacterium]